MWAGRTAWIRAGRSPAEAKALRVADKHVAGDCHVLLHRVLEVREELVVEWHELRRVAHQLALVARALVGLALGRELAVLAEAERREVRLRAGASHHCESASWAMTQVFAYSVPAKSRLPSATTWSIRSVTQHSAFPPVEAAHPPAPSVICEVQLRLAPTQLTG